MRIIVFFILSAVMLGGCITTQKSALIESRIYNLEQENFVVKRDTDYLKSAIDSKDQALRSDFAVLKADLDSLREELQSLRGELEAARHQLTQKQGEVSNASTEKEEQMIALSKGLLERVTAVERYLGLESSALSSGNKEAEPAADETEGGNAVEDRLYETARQSYETGDYEAARKGFEELISKHPKSDLCDNARFWIGESYFREKWYEKAILEYQKVVDKYPKGNKLPAALLKQGIAFQYIGKTTEAKLIFNKLVTQFPGSSDAKVAQQKLTEF